MDLDPRPKKGNSQGEDALLVITFSRNPIEPL